MRSGQSPAKCPKPVDDGADQVDPAAIRAELQKITSSKAFVQAPRLNRFLCFVVEEAIAGRGDALKEQVIGFEVFQKDLSYDPRIDPVVRTEARRLRYKLTEYYDTEGRDDLIHIDLPKGTYCPSFRARPPRAFALKTARLYASKKDLDHPLLSPIYSELRGLPTLLILAG